MEVFPSEYQNIPLSRYEKIFVRHTISANDYGFLLLRVNPSMEVDENMNVVILPEGVVFIKFLDQFEEPKDVVQALKIYSTYLYPQTTKRISSRYSFWIT